MTKYAPHRADAAARAKAKVGHSNVVGMCAHEVIVNILGIPAPWKWGGSGNAYAVNYFLGAKKVVKTSDPAKVPAGAVVIWGPRKGATTAGGKAGHIAIGAGGGYCYSTDLPKSGTWGKVKISDVIRLWSKPLLGYVLVDGMGWDVSPVAVAPAPAKPKPPAKVKPATWYGVDYRNLAGFNTQGAKTWAKRIPLIVADIAEVGYDVIAVVELPDGKEKDFTKRMKAIGYKCAVGDLGRYLYVKNAIPVGPVKVMDLQPRLKSDTKQGVAAILTIGGNETMVCTAQLENEDASGNMQVKQAVNLIDKTLTFADNNDVAHTWVVFALDTNSDSRVRKEAFKPAGFVDAADVAYSSELAPYATYTGWTGKTPKGPRIDLIAVAAKRPVVRYRVRTKSVGLSDHLSSIAIIGLA